MSSPIRSSPTPAIVISSDELEKIIHACESDLNTEQFSSKLFEIFQVDESKLAKGYFQQGEYFYKYNEYETAMMHYSAALRKWREVHLTSPHKDIAICLHRLAIVLENLGRLPEALRTYEEALQMHKDLYGTKNKLDLASHLQDVGTVLQKLGCFAEAKMRFEEALALCKEECGLEGNQDLMFALKTVGSISLDMERAEEALLYFEEALSLSEKLSHQNNSVLLELTAIILSQKSHALAMLKRFPEALIISEELLQQEKKRYGSQANPEVIRSLKSSVAILEALKHYPAAAEKCKEALHLHILLYGEKENLEKAKILNMLGVILRSSDDLSSALDCHSQALKIFEEAYGQLPNHNVAITLNYLAIVLARLKRTKEAIDFYGKAMNIANALNIPGIHSIKATTLQNTVLSSQKMPQTGELYTSSHEVIQALWGGRNLLSEASEVVSHVQCGPVDPLTLEKELSKSMNKFFLLLQEKKIEVMDNELLISIKLYQNFGIYLRSLGHLYEAKSCIELSLKMYKIVYQPNKNHPEIANCLDSLGGILRDLGFLQNAKICLKKAFEMRKKLCCPEDPNQATCLKNLGDKLGALTNNFELFQNYAHLTTSLDHLGNLLREFGFYNKAKEHIQLALEMRQQLFPTDHENNIISLNSLGTLLREAGNFNEALKCYETALQLVGPKTLILNGLGLNFLELGDTEEAMQRFRQAYNIAYCTPSTSTQHREVADSIENLGHCLGFLGKFHEAIDKHRIVYSIRVNHFGQDNYHAANALCNIGFYLHRIGHYEEELENYQKALSIQKNVFGENHPVVATILDNIGCCLSKLGNHEKAKQSLLQALDIRKRVFHEQHPLVAISLDNLGLCYSCSGDIKGSLKNFQESLEIRKECFENEHPLIKLSLSHIETCENIISPPIDSESTKEVCQLGKVEFEKLVKHALEYIGSFNESSKLTLEKNPTGFIRIRLPVPQEFACKIETIRLNYWLPEIKFPVVEAPHNHPRYFESMIIKGGYTHHLYKKNTSNDTLKKTVHLASRIFKSNYLDRRNIFSIGEINLVSIGKVEVKAGARIAFPRNMIHQVLTTEKGTMSINCVFKNEENRNYYDVFMPNESSQDPQVDRDALMSDECHQILLTMKTILEEWIRSKDQ